MIRYKKQCKKLCKGGRNMKFVPDKKYSTIATYCVIVFAVCLAMIIVVFRFEGISAAASRVFAVISPVTWGLVISYLLNPGMVKFDGIYNRLLGKKKPHKKAARCLSIATMAVISLAIITALIYIILPQIIDSITGLVNNIPGYIKNTQTKINEIVSNNPQIASWFNDSVVSLENLLTDFVTELKPKISGWVSGVTDGIKNVLIGLKDFLFGFIVSIYLLFSKELFIGQTRKLICAFLPEKGSKLFFDIASEANYTFSKFISGKALDSLIIGILCFIGCTLLQMPYALLISVIVGITNMIPFFGPFIGAVPSILLILITDPVKALIFALFILFLQQLDGNFIGPKILGDSTGLPAFWVMFSIFLGGGLFGFAGMLLCVPMFALIYSLSRKLIANQLTAKGMSTDTSDYIRSADKESMSDSKEIKPEKKGQ